MYKFSVIMALYNSHLDTIKLTLDSVIRQDLEDFELVVADDASTIDLRPEIESYLRGRGFTRTKWIRHEKNLGTVKNFLAALHFCEGKYTKGIGPGDLLYAEDTLSRLYAVMEEKDTRIGFGDICSFRYNEEKVPIPAKFTAPKYLPTYVKGKPAAQKKSMILYHNWLAGISMVAQTSVFIEYITPLVDVVLYTEDKMQVLMLLAGEEFHYFGFPVVLYEYGTGISTDKASPSKLKRMQADDANFIALLGRLYPDDSIVQKKVCLYENQRQQKYPPSLYSIAKRSLTDPYYLYFEIKTRLPISKKQRLCFENSLLFTSAR